MTDACSCRRTVGAAAWSLGVLAAVVVLTAGTAAAGGDADERVEATGEHRVASETPAPRTLVQLGVRIAKFAQDGERLAWMTGRCRDPGVDARHVGNDDVAVRSLATGRTVTLTRRACRPNFAENAGGNGRLQAAGLALAGTRVLFWHPAYYGGTGYMQVVTRTVTLGDRRVRDVNTGIHFSSGSGEGGLPTGVDGDGALLALAVTAVGTRDDDDGRYCWYGVAGGQILSIGSGKARTLRGAPAAAFVDVAGARVALIPAAPRFDHCDENVDPVVPDVPHVPARTPARVEVRDAGSGAVRLRVAVHGTVWGLALSNETIAVLVDERGRRRIDRFDARTGSRMTSIPVPRNTTEIDADGHTIVYLSGLDIRVVGATTRLQLRAAAKPIGLSIEGRRVAWAENIGAGGRIRAANVASVARFR